MMKLDPRELLRAVSLLLVLKALMSEFDEEMLRGWSDELKVVTEEKPTGGTKGVGDCKIIYLFGKNGRGRL